MSRQGNPRFPYIGRSHGTDAAGGQREQKKTLVMVTHDDHLATYADRVFHIQDGRIIKIEDNRWKRGKEEGEEDMQKRIQKETGNNCLKRIICCLSGGDHDV